MSYKIIIKRFEPVFFILLAVIFTIGLMFASVEIPKTIDQVLNQKVDFLDVASGQNEISEYKTELFLSYYHIRLIGYTCLGLILILIVTGFVLEKRALASAGAIFLFLPVFGHFAATMFFLGGLAFLRFLWLPFLDISFDIMRFGDIILLPYDWILKVFSLFGVNLYRELPFIFTGLGIFVFLMGVLAWMYGRIRKQSVTDFCNDDYHCSRSVRRKKDEKRIWKKLRVLQAASTLSVSTSQFYSKNFLHAATIDFQKNFSRQKAGNCGGCNFLYSTVYFFVCNFYRNDRDFEKQSRFRAKAWKTG